MARGFDLTVESLLVITVITPYVNVLCVTYGKVITQNQLLWSTGQFWHSFVVGTEYFPFSHPLTHVVPSADTCWLLGHTNELVHSDSPFAPAAEFGLAAGQVAQVELEMAATTDEYLPMPHFTQDDADDALVVLK